MIRVLDIKLLRELLNIHRQFVDKGRVVLQMQHTRQSHHIKSQKLC